MRIVLLPFLLTLAGSLLAQGPLTPSGAPAPTMKTLEQVEARRPISSLPFTISTPGSYYVTGDLQPPPNGTGIHVTVNHVTIDLNGFALIGNGGSTNAIFSDGGTTNLTVRNGTLRNWGSSAINGESRVRAADLRVIGNGAGILVGTDALVTDCLVEGNSGPGITADGGALIERCIALSNSGSLTEGIRVGSHSIVRRCIARDNGDNGIQAGASLVSECEAVSNNGAGIVVGPSGVVKGSQSFENDEIGISGGIRSLVRECTASGNGGSGIVVQGDSVVIENRASANGRLVAAVGIDSSSGGGSRIESNHTRDNTGTGIKAAGLDIVIRNSSGGNSVADYNPTSGTNFAPIQTPSGATHPLANL